MFDNIGGKIKKLAKIICWIGIILSVITGIAAMMFFHIFENIGMVIGVTPVTGIPLPFVSYGGSNYLTNIIGIGLVINVTMRSRARTRKIKTRVIEPAKL